MGVYVFDGEACSACDGTGGDCVHGECFECAGTGMCGGSDVCVVCGMPGFQGCDCEYLECAACAGAGCKECGWMGRVVFRSASERREYERERFAAT